MKYKTTAKLVIQACDKDLPGVFGHGCVVGVGQALAQGDHNLRFYQGKNEQNMALAAMAPVRSCTIPFCSLSLIQSLK